RTGLREVFSLSHDDSLLAFECKLVDKPAAEALCVLEEQPLRWLPGRSLQVKRLRRRGHFPRRRVKPIGYARLFRRRVCRRAGHVFGRVDPVSLALERITWQRHAVASFVAVKPSPVDRHSAQPKAAEFGEKKLEVGLRLARVSQ